MDGTQRPHGKTPASKTILVTFLALISVISGFVVGIYAALAGQLTLYPASAAGGGSAVLVFGLGMVVLAYLRE